MRKILLCLIIIIWCGILGVIFIPVDKASLYSKNIEVQIGEVLRPISFKPLNKFGTITARPIFYNDITIREEVITPVAIDAESTDELSIHNFEVLGVMKTGEGWRANIIHADLQSSIWVSVGDRLGLSTVSEISKNGLSLSYSDRDEAYLIYNSLDGNAGKENLKNPNVRDEN